MSDLRKAAEMALKYFEDAHGLEDEEVAIREALRQALAQPEPNEVLAEREAIISYLINEGILFKDGVIATGIRGLEHHG